MRNGSVALLLSGDATRSDSSMAWAEALARVPARRHWLKLDSAASNHSEQFLARCTDLGIDLVESLTPGVGEAGVLIFAAADDLPTPGALVRLVEAICADSPVATTRLLPYGPTAEDADAIPTPAPVVCLAVDGSRADVVEAATSAADAAERARRAGLAIRTSPLAAVFHDRRPGKRPAPVALAADPPYGHPGSLHACSLHQLLVQTRLPVPELPADLPARPLLTVITRTQGTRLICLEEVLTCLAAQTSRDFEVVLAAHRVTASALAAVKDVVDRFPEWLRERVRLLEVERPGRSSPLNDALDIAQGRYAVMLDDDDAVMADWVEQFAQAEARGPGTVLRTVALRQDVRPASDHFEELGGAHSQWPEEFSLVNHLWDNESPPMIFAFPRGVFVDLGHRFDEALDTTEDWDYFVRAAAVSGVTSAPALTAAYRIWVGSGGSRQLHDAEHWAKGRAQVLRTFDDMVMLLSAGAAADVRGLHQAIIDETAEKFRFAKLNEEAAETVARLNSQIAEPTDGP